MLPDVQCRLEFDRSDDFAILAWFLSMVPGTDPQNAARVYCQTRGTSSWLAFC